MSRPSIEGEELRYSSDTEPGITRIPAKEGFRYLDPSGKLVRERRQLDRIKSLAIPPAYTNVWICEDPCGHLQATGRDARGRKQYRYHPKFREQQEANKFHRLIDFGRALPQIRSALAQDLGLPGVPKRRVLAAVVTLLDLTLIRVGNEEYVKENHSYGLTTMLSRHVTIQGADLKFHFVGKSHVRHQIEIHDRRLARLLAKIDELPGRELFHYLDEEGRPHAVTSSDVNAYLREISGSEFTAKDFRTWWGTVLATQELAHTEAAPSERMRKATIGTAVKKVATRLGNTPAICRKCYIHPQVFDCYRSGSLASAGFDSDTLDQAESAVLCLLENSLS
jgi:DNA topoisomerase-1